MSTTPEKARQCMNTIDQTYRALFIGILEIISDSDDINKAIDDKIRKLQSLPKVSSIIPSATGAKSAEGKISTKNSISFQLQMIRTYLSFLKANNCLSAEVNFAIDPTHFQKATKRLPRYTRYIVEGQKVTRKKGIRTDDIYDTTHGINLMFFIGLNHKVGVQRTKMPQWIDIFESIIEIYAEFNVRVVNIFGDREYSNSYNYGAFSSGKLTNLFGKNIPIRLVVPTKFYSGNPKKSSKEIHIPDWEITTMKLYQKKIKSYSELMKYLAAFFEVKRHGNIQVPILEMAFYEEEGVLTPLSESDFSKKIDKLAKEIEEYVLLIENNYKSYQNLIKNDKPKKRTQKKWLYNRKGNKRFESENDEMYNLWLEAMRWKNKCGDRRERLRKTKKKLRFYTVSITKEECELLENGHASSKKALINRITRACYEYHQRWGIENYFAFIKRDILHINKTRSVNWMNIQWFQAQLIYNGYVLKRTVTITAEKRKIAFRWKPTDAKLKTRKKPLDSRDYHLMSFNQYITEIMGKCLQFRLKQIYT